MYLLFRAAFDVHPIHVLQVRGRTAFLASEIGSAAGHCEDGATFLDLVNGDLAPSLHEDDDVAQLTPVELAALRREVPVVGDSVLVLFRSGAEKALPRSGARHATALLAFLRRQVFPRGGMNPANTPAPAPEESANEPTKPALTVVNTRPSHPRRAEYGAILHLADELAASEEIDEATWWSLQIEAVEQLIGRRLRTRIVLNSTGDADDSGPAAA